MSDTPLVAPEAVRRLVLAMLAPLPPQRVALTAADGLVAAAALVVGENLPRFPNAAMDGFAVRAADVLHTPAVLRIVGWSLPGAPCERAVGWREAVGIATGAVLPAGADAVVPVEEAVATGAEVVVTALPIAGRHARREGEDVTAGQVVVDEGTVIGPGQIVVAAALGLDHLLVRPRPRVAILPTGDELRPAASSLGPGQVYDAISAALAALVIQAGGIPCLQPIAPDDPAKLTERLRKATLDADAVVTVGGVSAGERDYMRRLGGPVRVEAFQVALRPARPFAFGTAFGKLLFALPGNPASALASFEEFVRPAVRSMMGKPPLSLPTVRAELTEPLLRERGYRHLVRAHVWEQGGRRFVRSAGHQGAGMVHSLAAANAWAVVPPDVGRLPPGAEIEVRMLSEPSPDAPPR